MGVRRTRPRCEDPGLGRVDRRDPRPAKRGVLEAEVSKKRGDGGVRPRAENIEVETGTFAAAR